MNGAQPIPKLNSGGDARTDYKTTNQLAQQVEELKRRLNTLEQEAKRRPLIDTGGTDDAVWLL